MNQGKLEMVKQEMASVNIDILGMGEVNSDDHYVSNTMGKNPQKK